LELRQLRYFLAVAREGSYGRAASSLNVAQPALSRQIKKLEEELGVDLFVRHTYGITLTHAAELLVPHSKQVLHEVAAIKRLVQDQPVKFDATMKIGVSPGTAEILAYPLSQLLARRYPGLRCEYVSMLMPARADLLREGKMTLTVMNLFRHVEGLLTIPLMREPLCLIHRPDDTRFGNGPLHLGDLVGVPLVLGGASDSPIRSMVEEGFASAGLTLTVAAEANTAGACKALVKEGVGPSIHVGAMARTEIERDELRALPIQNLYSVRVIALPAGREMTDEIRALMSAVRECMANLVKSGKWPGAEMIRERPDDLT